MAATPALRYSPVNWLIVQWGFPACGLPMPDPCEPAATTPAAPTCIPTAAIIAPDTYGWERFLSNVSEGLEDPNDDIMADKAREVAIEFAVKSMTLQREIALRIQPGTTKYPLSELPGERIVGLISAKRDDECGCPCSGVRGSVEGISFHVGQNEIVVDCTLRTNTCEELKLLVYSAPTEDACAFDVLLYDEFRAVISQEARRRYAKMHYYKDRYLMASLGDDKKFIQDTLNAKRRATKSTTVDTYSRGSELFAATRRRTAANIIYHNFGVQ
jgi:hypothetical protein